MYKLMIVVTSIVALATADVSHLFKKGNSHSGGHHQQSLGDGILRSHSEISPDGSYQYGYETDTGIVHDESATFQQKGPEEGVISAQGKYSFTSPEGEHIEISYVADENGFQPQGSHIPQPPPIPDAIQRAIDYVLTHPEQTPARGHSIARG